MIIGDVPIIGQSVESIPAEKVMEAMKTLEEELRVYYMMLMEEIDDRLKRVESLINDTDDSVTMSALSKAFYGDDDEVQEAEV